MMGAFNKNVCERFTKGSHHRNLSVIVVTQNIFHKSSHTRDILQIEHFLSKHSKTTFFF